ncbi:MULTISPECIES: CDP-diacylglycerol--serine O-phosphatidyltransferase [Spongiibacter]|jgi:CDP-diacylglycerol--serine O-phosphatidyltransferase|uniref:CDP-diacylglycerol--serine O-phosphatidyltransferase n=1 Tax=Spongiibacter TaxID=630749 RepID=UPI0003B61034|nr:MULTISPECIES: CDP-diacylglycerol--serine O-phosphatidyltransferase [Spongiibacter]MBO6754199.1 CDP-diacylglycerol--serine O-phosphatidyltransferase [Spongiibacter sp.]MBU71970.1 CDP-diacylglycerol--serine O-phosphatidyltransferase [Spongiibacter sp.]|tara:strand:- start:1748 stop:2578 length:831 start_codon:yes stop_codon:yes gene_type:complete
MADEQAGKKSMPQFEKEALLLIDDHEEEISENGKTVRKRGIYLLPNLFTTAALFSGFFAIVSAMNGQFEAAAIAIFVSMVFDGLDGRVARLMNAQSKFGAEYDSLADMVSFGVAPALVVFSWGVSELGKFGWAVAFIYVSCAALRLARFNTQIDTADKNFFTGLASPAAAAVMAGVVWVSAQEGWVAQELPIELAAIAGLLMAVIGMLMIVNVRYNSFKGIDFKGRVPFVVMILVVLAFGLISVDPARILLGIALVYALSGPVQASYRRLKKPPSV